jgi:hypothetical protein
MNAEAQLLSHSFSRNLGVDLRSSAAVPGMGWEFFPISFGAQTQAQPFELQA